MIAGLFLYASREMAALYDCMGKADDARRMRAYHADMLDAIETQAWDGEWYRRAYDADGTPVGSQGKRRGQDLHREPGLVRPGWRRRRQWPRRQGAGERAQAPLHQERRGAAAAAVLDLPPRARRSHQLPAGRTRKTPASSATTTPGSTSAGACLATATARSSTTCRSVPRPSRTRSKPTAASPTSTRR